MVAEDNDDKGGQQWQRLMTTGADDGTRDQAADYNREGQERAANNKTALGIRLYEARRAAEP
jgi:hypothetical protein